MHHDGGWRATSIHCRLWTCSFLLSPLKCLLINSTSISRRASYVWCAVVFALSYNYQTPIFLPTTVVALAHDGTAARLRSSYYISAAHHFFLSTTTSLSLAASKYDFLPFFLPFFFLRTIKKSKLMCCCRFCYLSTELQ